MAKAASTLLSITLLVAAYWLAEHRQRTRTGVAEDQPGSGRVQMDAGLTTTAEFLPTNIATESNAVPVLEEP